MAKDPAVLFYTSDFLTGTAFFTMEQKGQYITLLCLQHQHESIPENHMISICGSLDNPVIGKFIKDEQGNYFNERMKIESERRKSFCESRSNNKSGRPKKESNDNHKEITSKSYDNHKIIHMETENETVNINKKNSIYTIEFLSFWTAYPKKVGKDAAWKAWKNRNGSLPEINLILNTLEIQKKSSDWLKDKGQYIPHPATWINQGRWNDEPVKQESKAAW